MGFMFRWAKIGKIGENPIRYGQVSCLSCLLYYHGRYPNSAAPKIRKESEGQTVWWEEFAGYSSQALPHQQTDGEDGQDDVCKKADHIIL